MSKKVKIVLIVLVIAILVGIVSYIIFRNNINKEDNKLPVDFKMPTESELLEMEDSALLDLCYTMPKGEDFVNEKTMHYESAIECVDSVEDAIEDRKRIREIRDDIEIVELKLQEETEYYYVIYEDSILHRDYGNRNIKSQHLYFKKSVFNNKDKKLNMDILNTADKVKEVFSLYLYASYYSNGSIKFLLPEITENSNEYIYTYYYFSIVSGDWGLYDRLELYKSTVTINKESGKYEIVKNKVRELNGKYNEHPY